MDISITLSESRLPFVCGVTITRHHDLHNFCTKPVGTVCQNCCKFPADLADAEIDKKTKFAGGDQQSVDDAAMHDTDEHLTDENPVPNESDADDTSAHIRAARKAPEQFRQHIGYKPAKRRRRALRQHMLSYTPPERKITYRRVIVAFDSDDDETFFKQTPADHLKHGLQILFQIQSGI